MARGKSVASVDDDVYEIDKVLDRRKKGRSFEYLVRWKGQSEGADSWEPLKNFKNSKDALDQFLSEVGESPKRRRSTRSRSTSRSRSRSTSRSRRKSPQPRRTTKGRSTRTSARTSKSAVVTNTAVDIKSQDVVKKSSLPTNLAVDSDTDEENNKTQNRRITRSSVAIDKQDGNCVVDNTKVAWSIEVSKAKSLPRFLQLSCRTLPVILVVTSLIALFVSYFLYHHQKTISQKSS